MSKVSRGGAFWAGMIIGFGIGWILALELFVARWLVVPP